MCEARTLWAWWCVCDQAYWPLGQRKELKGSSLGETQLCNHLLSDTTVAYVQAGSSIWGDVIMHGAEHFLTHFSMRAPPKPPNPLPSARQAQRTHKHKGPVVTIARFHGNPKQTVSERSNPTPCLETASIIGRLFLHICFPLHTKPSFTNTTSAECICAEKLYRAGHV